MATVNAAEILNQVHERWIKAALATAVTQYRPPYSLICQKFTIPVAQTAAGSITRLWKFPAGAVLLNWRSTPSDMDTNGTPTITFSIVTTDDSDVTQVTIVSASTNAQAAAGSDVMIGSVFGRFVGNQWCSFKVGTGAATGAAGTVKVACSFALGSINRTNRGIYLKDAEI